MKKNGELCIRDKDKRIIAWCVGMSEEDIEEFLHKYVADGAHRSVATFDRWGNIEEVK